MEQKIEKYLQTVFNYLKPLSLSEKTDIINEIKSHIKEIQIDQQLDIDTILKNMGDPVNLAKSYVGETLAKNTTFNLMQIFRLIAFYSITGFSGMIVIPFLSILSASLYVCAFITPIAAIIKTVGTWLGFNVPFAIINLGFWEVPAALSIPAALPFTLLFYIASKKLWMILKKYLANVSKNYQTLH